MATQRGHILRAYAFEFALVLVLSVALAYAVLSGFDATMGLRTALGIEALIAGGMLLVLFAGGWSRRLRALSIVLAVVYAIVALGIALALAPADVAPMQEGGVNDVEGNYAIFVAVLLVCAVLCYVLSRFAVGSIVLAVAAVFTCGVTQFLFRDWLALEGGLVDFVVVLVTSVALVIYQRYRTVIVKSDHQQRPAFGLAFASGVVVALAATAVSGLLFALVIAPLGLTTPVLKPFEHRIVPPIVDYTGAYDQYLVEDPDTFSSLLNEREDATHQNAKGGSTPDDEQLDMATNPLVTFLQSMMLFSDEDWSEDFDPVSFERMRFGMLVVALLIVLAIVAIIIGRIRMRDIRLKRLEDKPNAQRVEYLYDFLLTRLKRLGMGRPATSTPLEYAYDSRRNLVPFTRGTGKVDFVRVTLIYQRAVYGGAQISDEEYDCVRRYYRAFFNNAHRYMGTPRWLWKFWRI